MNLGVVQSTRRLRVLHLDFECRPGFWYGGDFVTKIPTAVATMFADEEDEPEVLTAIGIGERGEQRRRRMIRRFVERYDAADVVVGHFLRGFDLLLANAELLRLGERVLGPKLTLDTKLDMSSRTGLSTSQENLCAMFEVEHQKLPGNEPLWRRACEGYADGVEWLKQRVAGDVVSNVELKDRLIALNALSEPKRWSGTAAGRSRYHA